MAEFRLQDLIDVEVLQQIQDGFSKYTGMSALTTDADGVPVTEGSNFTDFCMNLTRQSGIGYRRCEECDRNGAIESSKKGRPSVYSCHAGLVDFAAPIMLGEEVIGSFLGGQVRTEPVDEAKMERYAQELGIDPQAYVDAAKRAPMLERSEIEKAAEFLFELAKVLSEMAYRNYTALQQSRKQERAARSQSQFIMNLSLDMQKTIKEWITSAQNATESDDPVVLQQTMKQLLCKGTEAYSVVEDAAEYLRMAGDDLQLVENEYKVEDLLHLVKDNLYHYAMPRGLEIQTKISEEVPKELLGDVGRIAQLVSKIMQNILLHTEGGPISIEISGYRVSYATMLEIRVKDKSVELSEKGIEQICEYFSRENRTASEVDEAIGIGFAIITLLLRQLSATLEAENAPGGGAQIKVTLPQLEVRGDS